MLQLLGLLLVLDNQGVEEPGASDLELDVVGILLDLDTPGVLPSGLQEEVLKDKTKIDSVTVAEPEAQLLKFEHKP